MNETFFLIVAFIFGACIGSFLNVVIWRLPREQSLRGRSQCPHCDVTLRAYRLVPILSFLWQRGRCASCGKLISHRYWIIELITGLLFAGAACYFFAAGLNMLNAIELLRALFIIAVLIAVFVIDLEHYLILDVIVWPASLVVLVSNIILDALTKQSLLSWGSYTADGLIAAIAAGGFFYLLWLLSQGRWMGFGDVKFNLFLGLALGLPGIVVALFLAFMIGAVVGLSLIISGAKQLQSRVPFGTFLTVGALIALFYSDRLAQWYGRLIGWQ